MEVFGYISILIMSVLITVAQVLLKKSALNLDGLNSTTDFLDIFKSTRVLIALFCTALAPLFYLGALWVFPLNKAFMLTSINMLIVPIVGKFYFKEHLSRNRILGIFLIMIGVIVYAWPYQAG